MRSYGLQNRASISQRYPLEAPTFYYFQSLYRFVRKHPALFPVMFVAGGALKGDVSSFAGGIHWQCFEYSLWLCLLRCRYALDSGTSSGNCCWQDESCNENDWVEVKSKLAFLDS